MRPCGEQQPSEQPVKYYVTGSAAIEDLVEAGTQDLGLLAGWAPACIPSGRP